MGGVRGGGGHGGGGEEVPSLEEQPPSTQRSRCCEHKGALSARLGLTPPHTGSLRAATERAEPNQGMDT